LSPIKLLRSASFVIVAGFLVRVLFLLLSQHAQNVFHVDLQITGQESGLIAWSLATGQGFSHPFRGYEASTGWLAPVFPALWSVGFRIFDPKLGEGGIYYCQLLNAAFSAFTCWPIYWLGRKVFNIRIGLAAAWAWAFMPLAILFPLEWTWDQSLSAMVLAFLACATYKTREARADSMVWTGYGCMWGFAALVNPALCVVLPFFLFWIVCCRRLNNAPALRPVLRFVLLFVLAIIPWTIRNYYKLDGLMFVKSNFGLELWLGNNPSVPANNVYSPQLNPVTNSKELLQLALAGEPGYMRMKQRAAVAFIRANPGIFARLVGRRMLDTWAASTDSHLDQWIVALRLSRATIVFCVSLSVLAWAGVSFALRCDLVQSLPITICIVIFTIPYYITHSSLRYRHPIDPFLTLLAVYAIARITSAALRTALRTRELLGRRREDRAPQPVFQLSWFERRSAQAIH
jgi:4-amino-4-deoxy-L-arabinose transferase-like glycosyltransferase